MPTFTCKNVQNNAKNKHLNAIFPLFYCMFRMILCGFPLISCLFCSISDGKIVLASESLFQSANGMRSTRLLVKIHNNGDTHTKSEKTVRQRYTHKKQTDKHNYIGLSRNSPSGEIHPTLLEDHYTICTLCPRSLP